MDSTNIISICWNVTTKCNLSCAYCYRERDSKIMHRSLWSKVISNLVRAGVVRLAVAGGEPTLIPDLYKLFSIAKSEGLLTCLITNGTLLTHDIANSFSGVLDEIVFSIDAEDAQTHAELRKTSQQTFWNILDLLKIFKTNRIRCRVNSVITKANLHKICGLGKYLAPIPIDEWRLMQFFPLHDAISSSSEYSITDEEFNAVIQNIQSTNYLDASSIVAASNDTMDGSYLVIAPDGTLYSSSPGYRKNIGNVLLNELFELQAFGLFNTQNHVKQYKALL
ncbi:MAG: radical SAM protein [Proteobacteria bacterium]|nr:radical SAM protein [Pseudomonadota bacterium]